MGVGVASVLRQGVGGGKEGGTLERHSSKVWSQ